MILEHTDPYSVEHAGLVDDTGTHRQKKKEGPLYNTNLWVPYSFGKAFEITVKTSRHKGALYGQERLVRGNKVIRRKFQGKVGVIFIPVS